MGLSGMEKWPRRHGSLYHKARRSKGSAGVRHAATYGLPPLFGAPASAALPVTVAVWAAQPERGGHGELSQFTGAHG